MPRTALSSSYKVLIERLVDARRSAGLKQTDLAAILHKPQSFVSKVENGERRLNVVEFLIYSRAMGIDGVELMQSIADELPTDERI